MNEVLLGEVPHEQIQQYRQALTDYYSGKTAVSPDRGRMP